MRAFLLLVLALLMISPVLAQQPIGRAVIEVDSSFDLAKRVQGRGTTPALAERDGRLMLQMNVTPGKDQWPGMYMKPESGVWDLTGCNRVEFILTNTGGVPCR